MKLEVTYGNEVLREIVQGNKLVPGDIEPFNSLYSVQSLHPYSQISEFLLTTSK